ncbi:MAG: ABC transporter ATP-binding protein [Desulfovibrionales bacterium]|nr:MAG: ABC transporter ATP-binding protein [Desulfovibrionales bacterium]
MTDHTRSMTPIIEARNLHKRFGTFTAVDDLSFRVEKGEFFGVLGPNGAGKTTAIRMIYGFSPLTSGSMRVFGLNIEQGWREIRSRLGVCQQENTLDPDLTVEQNLLLFAGYFSLPKVIAGQRSRELLEYFALEHKKQAKVEHLSGGMARRLMLARALINDPELVILDEPTTGLDPQSRHQVWDKLKELRSRGLTMLLTTHYMEEAAWLCDRLIIVDHGKILVEGTPRALIREHAGDSVVEVETPSEALREFTRSRNLQHDDLGNRLIIYNTLGPDLEHQLRGAFCDQTCTFRQGSLEDVFLRLTGRGLRE